MLPVSNRPWLQLFLTNPTPTQLVQPSFFWNYCSTILFSLSCPCSAAPEFQYEWQSHSDTNKSVHIGTYYSALNLPLAVKGKVFFHVACKSPCHAYSFLSYLINFLGKLDKISPLIILFALLSVSNSHLVEKCVANSHICFKSWSTSILFNKAFGGLFYIMWQPSFSTSGNALLWCFLFFISHSTLCC